MRFNTFIIINLYIYTYLFLLCECTCREKRNATFLEIFVLYLRTYTYIFLKFFFKISFFFRCINTFLQPSFPQRYIHFLQNVYHAEKLKTICTVLTRLSALVCLPVYRLSLYTMSMTSILLAARQKHSAKSLQAFISTIFVYEIDHISQTTHTQYDIK